MILSLRNYYKFLEIEASVKFLGITLDPILTWNCHIDSLSTKLSKNIYLLRKLVSRVPSKILRNALCHSLMSYIVVGWGQAADAGRLFAFE